MLQPDNAHLHKTQIFEWYFRHHGWNVLQPLLEYHLEYVVSGEGKIRKTDCELGNSGGKGP